MLYSLLSASIQDTFRNSAVEQDLMLKKTSPRNPFYGVSDAELFDQANEVVKPAPTYNKSPFSSSPLWTPDDKSSLPQAWGFGDFKMRELSDSSLVPSSPVPTNPFEAAISDDVQATSIGTGPDIFNLETPIGQEMVMGYLDESEIGRVAHTQAWVDMQKINQWSGNMFGEYQPVEDYLNMFEDRARARSRGETDDVTRLSEASDNGFLTPSEQGLFKNMLGRYAQFSELDTVGMNLPEMEVMDSLSSTARAREAEFNLGRGVMTPQSLLPRQGLPRVPERKQISIPDPFENDSRRQETEEPMMEEDSVNTMTDEEREQLRRQGNQDSALGDISFSGIGDFGGGW